MPRTIESLADVDDLVRDCWDPAMLVRQWWEVLANAGLAHPTWPIGLGGRGASVPEARALHRQLGVHDVVAPAEGVLGASLGAPTVLAHGDQRQRSTYLGDIAHGRTAWCQLFSEPDAGSDLPSLRTRAEWDGSEWVITGHKVWSSGADLADTGMLLARTDPGTSGREGLTYFVIDLDQPGVEVRPLRVMNGRAPFCEIFLDEARVADSERLGAVGDGWRVARTTLAAERSMVAGGQTAGLHPARSGPRGDLDVPVGEIVERSRRAHAARRGTLRSGAVPAQEMLALARKYGRNDQPVVRQDLARYWSQVRIDGWTMRRVAAAGGRLTGADGNLAKLATANICRQSADLAYRIAGAALLLTGPDTPLGGSLQEVNLGAPGNRIGGGTDEIQRNHIGERALGLPTDRPNPSAPASLAQGARA